MSLFRRFEKYVQETLSVTKSDKILLAVSGGRDSMLMACLFLRAGYTCVIAHCNFGLRQQESDLDEALVREFAAEKQVPFFAKRFDTTAYAAAKGISIQMAARDLRYEWFEALRLQEEAQWIAIAQHQNDHIETVLLNLTRGTGLQGLRGILPKRDRLIRPLLFLSATEVAEFVQTEGIPYRDDQSNFSTKYARNKIRLDIVPRFKEITPDFDQVMVANIRHFEEAYTLLEAFVDPIRKRLFTAQGDKIAVSKADLAGYIHDLSLLFELFKPYNFPKDILSDLQGAWQGDSGKRFQSASHELLLDREWLWIRPLATVEKLKTTVVLNATDASLLFAGREFLFSVSEDLSIKGERAGAQVDWEKLVFPLRLRYWEMGDVFYPLGMVGKKKVSDFFIQQKIGVYDKKDIPIVVNGNGEIIWIVGYRLDNRYRITESTKKVFTLVCK